MDEGGIYINSNEGIRLQWPGKDAAPKDLVCSEHSFQLKISYGRDVRNFLFHGDNLRMMTETKAMFEDQIQLIYIDPPFCTGKNFQLSQLNPNRSCVNRAKTEDENAFTDVWRGGIESYLDMLYPRLKWMRRLLKPNGSIYVHLDSHAVHYVKILMDEIFGQECFQREIIWRIGWISGYKSMAKNWIRNHDTILYYTKSPEDFIFNKTYVPYAKDYTRRGGGATSGKGYPIDDVWNASSAERDLRGPESLDSIQIKSFSMEKLGYATQKNESLIRRIVKASSNPGDLVADFFCGAGTTLAVAHQAGRSWIGCDVAQTAIEITLKRLTALDDSGSFSLFETPGK